jgi:hypothetical protein
MMNLSLISLPGQSMGLICREMRDTGHDVDRENRFLSLDSFNGIKHDSITPSFYSMTNNNKS